jgi:hypothetical protein
MVIIESTQSLIAGPRRRQLLLGALAAATAPAWAATAPRLALVIGNAAYADGARKAQEVMRVTAVRDGLVHVNDGDTIYDQMGGIVNNRYGRKDPVYPGAPSGLQVGKRWHTAFNNTRPGAATVRSFYDMRVTALEDVDVPAGRFKAFRIEGDGEAMPMSGAAAGGRRLQTVSWMDPQTLLPVRGDVRQTSRSDGRVLEHNSSVLLWRQLVPRS